MMQYGNELIEFSENQKKIHDGIRNELAEISKFKTPRDVDACKRTIYELFRQGKKNLRLYSEKLHVFKQNAPTLVKKLKIHTKIFKIHSSQIIKLQSDLSVLRDRFHITWSQYERLLLFSINDDRDTNGNLEDRKVEVDSIVEPIEEIRKKNEQILDKILDDVESVQQIGSGMLSRMTRQRERLTRVMKKKNSGVKKKKKKKKKKKDVAMDNFEMFTAMRKYYQSIRCVALHNMKLIKLTNGDSSQKRIFDANWEEAKKNLEELSKAIQQFSEFRKSEKKRMKRNEDVDIRSMWKIIDSYFSERRKLMEADYKILKEELELLVSDDQKENDKGKRGPFYFEKFEKSYRDFIVHPRRSSQEGNEPVSFGENGINGVLQYALKEKQDEFDRKLRELNSQLDVVLEQNQNLGDSLCNDRLLSSSQLEPLQSLGSGSSKLEENHISGVEKIQELCSRFRNEMNKSLKFVDDLEDEGKKVGDFVSRFYGEKSIFIPLEVHIHDDFIELLDQRLNKLASSVFRTFYEFKKLLEEVDELKKLYQEKVENKIVKGMVMGQVLSIVKTIETLKRNFVVRNSEIIVENFGRELKRRIVDTYYVLGDIKFYSKISKCLYISEFLSILYGMTKKVCNEVQQHIRKSGIKQIHDFVHCEYVQKIEGDLIEFNSPVSILRDRMVFQLQEMKQSQKFDLENYNRIKRDYSGCRRLIKSSMKSLKEIKTSFSIFQKNDFVLFSECKKCVETEMKTVAGLIDEKVGGFLEVIEYISQNDMLFEQEKNIPEKMNGLLVESDLLRGDQELRNIVIDYFIFKLNIEFVKFIQEIEEDDQKLGKKRVGQLKKSIESYESLLNFKFYPYQGHECSEMELLSALLLDKTNLVKFLLLDNNKLQFIQFLSSHDFKTYSEFEMFIEFHGSMFSTMPKILLKNDYSQEYEEYDNLMKNKKKLFTNSNVLRSRERVSEMMEYFKKKLVGEKFIKNLKIFDRLEEYQQKIHEIEDYGLVLRKEFGLESFLQINHQFCVLLKQINAGFIVPLGNIRAGIYTTENTIREEIAKKIKSIVPKEEDLQLMLSETMKILDTLRDLKASFVELVRKFEYCFPLKFTIYEQANHVVSTLSDRLNLIKKQVNFFEYYRREFQVGKCVYEGSYDDDFMFSGKGEIFKKKKSIIKSRRLKKLYSGNFRQGLKHGEGVCFYPKNKLEVKQIWKDGVLKKIVVDEEYLKSKLVDLSKEVLSHGDILSEGQFSNCYKIQLNNGTKTIACAKILKSHLLDQIQINDNDLREEARILLSMNHNNVVKTLAWSNTNKKTGIITEYFPRGSLNKLLVSGSEYVNSFDKKVDILIQISSAVHYLHETMGICHQDLNLDHIFMDENGVVKVGDFGASMQEKLKKSIPFSNLRGLSWYCAPEILNIQAGDGSEIKSTAQYTQSCDVFSFGICVWFLYFAPKNVTTVHKNLYDARNNNFSEIQNNPNWKPSLPRKVPTNEKWLMDLMFKCTSYDPNKRGNFEEVSEILKRRGRSEGVRFEEDTIPGSCFL